MKKKDEVRNQQGSKAKRLRAITTSQTHLSGLATSQMKRISSVELKAVSDPTD